MGYDCFPCARKKKKTLGKRERNLLGILVVRSLATARFGALVYTHVHGVPPGGILQGDAPCLQKQAIPPKAAVLQLGGGAGSSVTDLHLH